MKFFTHKFKYYLKVLFYIFEMDTNSNNIQNKKNYKKAIKTVSIALIYIICSPIIIIYECLKNCTNVNDGEFEYVGKGKEGHWKKKSF